METNEKYTSILKNTVDKLVNQDIDSNMAFKSHDNEPYPSNEKLAEFIDLAKKILFPGFFGNRAVSSHTIHYHIGVQTERLFKILHKQIFAGLCFECNSEERMLNEKKELSMNIAAQFIEQLPELKEILRTDVQAIYNGDPATENFGEIILAYPGLRAIVNYRIAHTLLKLGGSIIISRMITEMAHSETGIDIHPGATIGKYFAIDHGTGIVIGETAIIGENVKLYQGVTLGAKSFPTDENNIPIKGIERHPILQNDVIVYAGATILGRITIGKGAVIGGNAWVTDDVETGNKVFK